MHFVEAVLCGGTPLFVAAGGAAMSVRVSPRDRARTCARVTRFVHTLEPLITRRTWDLAALARKMRGPGMLVVVVDESHLTQAIDDDDGLTLSYANIDEMRAEGVWSDDEAACAACAACDYASACALCVCVRMDARVTALAYVELRYVQENVGVGPPE